MASAGVELDVCSLGGHLCHVSADEDWTVARLKDAIFEATGIYQTLQRLLHGQEELYDAELLSCLSHSTMQNWESSQISADLQTHRVQITLIKRAPEYHEWLKRIMRQPMDLQHAPTHITGDRDLVKAAVKINGAVLEFAQKFQSDPDILMMALETYGGAFRFASTELQSDKKTVLKAVRTNGCALGSASDELRTDPSIVEAAVTENEYAFKYAAKHLQEDKPFVKRLVAKNPDIFRLLPYNVRKGSNGSVHAFLYN